MNKNIGLKIIIIILSILIVIVGGYILYDKVLNVEEVREESNDQTDAKEEVIIKVEGNVDYKQLINELHKTFDVVYNYYYANGNSYCGSYDWNYSLSSSSDYRIMSYTASGDFDSYNEMIDYLKKYMSEDIIYAKETTNKEFYIEKDNRLYCGNLGKGGNMYEPSNMIIQINSINEDNINTTIAVELSYKDDQKTYKTYENHEITFSKLKERYIVTSYTRPSLW